MSIPNFYTYKEWIAIHPEVKGEPCDECNGTGEHDCDCGTSHECGYCKGAGDSSYVEYTKQLEYDTKQWIKAMSTIKPDLSK